MAMFRLRVSLYVLLMIVAASSLSAAQVISFNSPKDYVVGLSPHALQVGDLNLDGNLDIVVTNDEASTISVLLGNGGGGFQASSDFAAGSTPVAIAGGDFNKDGKPDVVVANNPSNLPESVSVLLGKGDGSFLAPIQTNLGTSGGPVSVAVADFNGDGNLDVAACLSLPNQIVILLGKGDGTFQAPITMLIGTNPSSIVAADFNKDKKADLAIASPGSGEVFVMLGNGDGSFQLPVSFSSGAAAPTALAVTDLNNDGKLDLVVGNALSGNYFGSLAALLGNGNGTFQAPKVSSTFFFGGPALAVGDLNGDGKPDVVVNANLGQNTGNVGDQAAVFWGNGDGTVQPPTGVAMAGGVWGVGIGDFNMDGRPDIAGAIRMGNMVQVRMNKGNKAFQQPPSFRSGGSGSESVTSADFNGDGNLDLAVGNVDTPNVTLLLGNGDSTFQKAKIVAKFPGPVRLVAAGDFNGDGKSDLIVSMQYSNDGQLFILLGNGDGSFQPSQSILKKFFAQQIIVKDFNRDGKLDMAILDEDLVWIFIGNGDGTFKNAVSYLAGYPTSITAADFNNDGVLDIAANGAGFVNVLLGNGDGTFSTAVSYYTSAFGGGIAAGDLNGDGKVDLVTGTAQDGRNLLPNLCAVLIGNGDGTFQTPVAFSVPNDASHLGLVDVNGDGYLDLAVLSWLSGDISIFPGQGNGTFEAGVNFAASSTPASLTFGDFNGDGKIDVAMPNASGREGTVLVLTNGSRN
jgi:hypothetical protein